MFSHLKTLSFSFEISMQRLPTVAKMPTNIFKENNFQESSEQPSREYFDLRILLVIVKSSFEMPLT